MVFSLTNEYRRIRRLRHEDVEILMSWDNDPRLSELTGKKFAKGDDAEAWWSALVRDRSRLIFAIVDDAGQLIGDVELQQIRWRAREAELRISIGDTRYWNQGYGTQAMGEALFAAFHLLTLGRVYLRVRMDNGRAIRSYQKTGFRSIGRLPATGRLAGYTDLRLMEITREHYLARSESARAAGTGFTSRE